MTADSRRRCLPDTSERGLADAVADGRITQHDADEVRDFTTLLKAMGPAPRRTSDGTPSRKITRVEAQALADYHRDRDPEIAAHFDQLLAQPPPDPMETGR